MQGADVFVARSLGSVTLLQRKPEYFVAGARGQFKSMPGLLFMGSSSPDRSLANALRMEFDLYAQWRILFVGVTIGRPAKLSCSFAGTDANTERFSTD